MNGLIITSGIFLIIVMVSGFFMYMVSRKKLREAKNYERGLKMVPLLIHLPPPSSDIDAGGRDNRDLVDENISRAQVLYDILASIAKKGFKTNFYGQRHISLEIIAVDGFVHFYTAVPLPLVTLVQQAFVSAYPSVRLEEVHEHNIFSPIGKLSGTIGGELVLKESFAYPIATYQDTKRDTMQALLNSLSTLGKEDGVGIQILLRPAHSGWRKFASGIASKKRKGKDSKKGSDVALSWIKQLAVAPVKPPDEKSSGSEQKQLSSLEQSIVDSIDDKTRHPGFEVLIRIVASSNIAQRSQAVLSNINASFSLFDAPGKNGFKFVPAKDIDSFVTAFILRFFPQEQTSNILNVVELSSLFHFPDQSNIPTSQLERQASKQVDGPRNISEKGLVLGYNIFRGVKKRINLDDIDRRRHIYIVGQTGTGKSVLMKNLAVQDMLSGGGFAFVDPHGDAVDELLSMVPRERTEDVIYFSPADMDYPLGLNLFEFDSPDQKDFLIQEAISMIYSLYDPNRQGMVGARFEHIFRNCALLLMSDPKGGTFVDIPKLLVDADFMREKLQYVTDRSVIDFWTKEWPASQRSNESGEVTSWVASKFGAFASNEMMRNIIGQTKSAFNLRDIMDNKKILLVNLSKGRAGELNSRLLGMIFVMKFQAAAMSRASMPEKDRTDFSLYVDEFQNYSTESFATILSEARKYGLNLIVGNQFTTQLTDEIRDAVFGNVGTIIAFRVGTQDAEALTKIFQPVFDADDLQRVPNYNAVVRMLIQGVPSQPFSMATLPPLNSDNQKLVSALKQLSAAKYGRPRAVVDAEIFERRATKPAAKPAVPYNSSPAPGSGPSPSINTPIAPKPGNSFLDDWLAKRQARPATTPQIPTSIYPTNAAVVGQQQNPLSPPTQNGLQAEVATDHPTDQKTVVDTNSTGHLSEDSAVHIARDDNLSA